MCVLKLINSRASNVLKAGILAVGGGNKVVEAVIGADGETVTSFCVFRPSVCCFDSVMTSLCHCFRSWEPSVVTKMNVTLSADHRIFDGQVGGNRVHYLHSVASVAILWLLFMKPGYRFSFVSGWIAFKLWRCSKTSSLRKDSTVWSDRILGDYYYIINFGHTCTSRIHTCWFDRISSESHVPHFFFHLATN